MTKLEAFQLDYCPEHLLFRTEVADRLINHLGPLILVGKPSTGKTTTAMWLQKQGKAVYVEGKSTLLQSLQSALKSYDTNLNRLIQTLVKMRKPVIFDDIQRWAEKKNRFNDWLFFIAEAFKEEPFVLVTNMDLKRLKGLVNEENERRLYRYPDSQIVLPPYGADQLAAIINNRIVEGEAEDFIDAPAVKYLAGMAKNNAYSLSRIFAMLRYWLGGKSKVTVELISKQFETVAVEDWKKQLLAMEKNRALLLLAAASVSAKNGKQGEENGGSTMGTSTRSTAGWPPPPTSTPGG